MKKIAISILILLILSGFLFFLFPDLFPRIKIYMEIKGNFSENETPWAYVVPVNRSLNSLIDIHDTHRVYMYNELEFKAPWDNLVKNIDIDPVKLFVFEHKKSIQLNYVDKNQFNILESLIDKNSQDIQFYKEIFGEINIKSEYAIYNLSLDTSPSQIHLLMPFNELGQKSIMLIVKAAIVVDVDKIFRFSTKNLRGFQFGEPDKNKEISVHIFDKKNRLFQIKFSSANQNEIDFILSSIKLLN